MSAAAPAPSARGSASAGVVLTPDRRRIVYAFGAAVLVFAVGAVLHPGFASADSIEAILVIASFVGFVAAGQTFVVLVGGIDLSVPWVLNGAAILLVTTLARPRQAGLMGGAADARDRARGRARQRPRRRLPRRARRRDDARR